MNIVNIIHIGDKAYRIDELPKDRQKEIWKSLNWQALKAVGYKKAEATA